MPVTLKTGVMKYRKSDGTYSVMDALMQEPTQDQIDAIGTAGQAQVTAVQNVGAAQASALQTAGQTQITAIQNKGTEIINSLPSDYTEIEQDVSELKSAIDSVTEESHETSTDLNNFFSQNNIEKKPSPNVCDPTKILMNTTLKINGDTQADNSHFVTDYIPISNGDKVYFFSNISTNFNAAKYSVYNSSKVKLSNGTWLASGSTISDSNAAFIRLDFQYSQADPNKMVVQINNSSTVYQPFGNDFSSYLQEIYVVENLFDVANVNNNKTFSTDAEHPGELVDDTDYFTTDYIPVEQGEKIYSGFNGIPQAFNKGYAYDENKAPIGAVTGIVGGYGSVISTSGVKFIRITAKHSLGDYRTVTIQKTQLTEGWTSYGTKLYKTENGKKIVDIRTSGGDYSSLRTAFETEGDNTLYQIWPGTYEVADDFTSEEISNAQYSGDASGFCGLIVPANSIVRGMGRKANCIIECNIPITYSQTVRFQISTLNLLRNCQIENLTILATNCRTPIHDDFILAKAQTHVIKNCILRNTTPTGGDSHGYGLGVRDGEKISMEDCDIYPTMIIHGSLSMQHGGDVFMKNCTVDGLLHVLDQNSQRPIDVVMDNCSYGCLWISTGYDTTHYTTVYNHSDCRNPIIFSQKYVEYGTMFPTLMADEAITEGNIVKLSGVSSISVADKMKNAFGVALSSGSSGDMIRVMKIFDYVDTTLAGISSYSAGDKVSLSDGNLVIDNDGTDGEVLYTSSYDGVGVIAVYR